MSNNFHDTIWSPLSAIAAGAILGFSIVIPIVHAQQIHRADELVLYCNTNMKSNFMAVLHESNDKRTSLGFFRDRTVKNMDGNLIGHWSRVGTSNDYEVITKDGTIHTLQNMESKTCDFHFTR